MKQTIRFNPAFTPASKTLDFSAFNDGESFSLSRLYAVINVTRKTLIFAAGTTGLGGTLSAGVVTLEFDTTSHSAGDVLNVIYDQADSLALETMAVVKSFGSTYIRKGGARSTDPWLIKRIVESGPNLIEVGYAGIRNNPTYSSGADAFFNRLSLVYGDRSEA